MATAYQYDALGYFAGPVEAFDLLPNNATLVAPELRAGFIPRWVDAAWQQVENHKGAQGYVDGQPFTMQAYGPLPQGFSAEAPAPTDEEHRKALLAAVQGHLDAFASSRGYDNALSCASYAGSSNPTYAAEAASLIAQRDQLWATAHTLLDATAVGETLPQAEVFIAALPQLVWA